MKYICCLILFFTLLLPSCQWGRQEAFFPDEGLAEQTIRFLSKDCNHPFDLEYYFNTISISLFLNNTLKWIINGIILYFAYITGKSSNGYSKLT